MLCLEVQYLLGYRIGATSRGSTLFASNSLTAGHCRNLDLGVQTVCTAETCKGLQIT